MKRRVGTVSRGIRCPIVREGNDIVELVTKSVIKASEADGFEVLDHDIIGLTESIVARAQGNFASVDAIAMDVSSKFGDETIGVIFPILSRNRFSTILKGIARGSKKIVLMLQFPSDEVGNALLTLDQLDEANVNPYSDVLDLQKYRDLFGYPKHPFTGMDYVSYYEKIVKQEGTEVEIIFSNDARTILEYTNNVLACDVHSNRRTKRILKESGVKQIYGLNDILTQSLMGSGYNPEYGLLGANKATEDSVKLFPRDGQFVVDAIQQAILNKTGKRVEVMIYGDGAFKDPMGKIWELADPTVAPAYTQGLEGQPHEIKLKYLADNDFKDLEGESLEIAITKEIHHKSSSSLDDRSSQGTTPRRIVDLVGSLCDLTSGSGDKGTPIVYIQGYFDNFSNN